jgi:hypothetical protein
MDRPWWGNPLLWVAVSAVFVLLGVFVAPHFLPGVVIFVPLLWVGRSKTRGPQAGNHDGGDSRPLNAKH